MAIGITLSKGEVSTHSHPKVAAKDETSEKLTVTVSTHSHPKVAAWISLFRAS